MAAGDAYKAKVNASKARQRKLEKARRDARAVLGCEACGASRDDIRTEQAWLKAAYLARQNNKTEPAAAPTATGS